MKLSVKRLLAVTLALVLCLSLLPGIAMAADVYEKVTDVSEITAGGQFVLVADGYAMTTTITGNKKFDGLAVNAGGSTLTGSGLPVWSIEAVSGGIALSVNGQYLGYESGTNFVMQATPYTWTVEAGENGFAIKSAADAKRGVFLQTSSSRFGAYSTSNKTGYVFELLLYKFSADAVGCAHTYTSELTAAATCTKDGVETYTCSLCGDSYTKAIEATGHYYVVGECVNCGAVIVTDPAKVIPEAFALADGKSLDYDARLTGKIVAVDTPYNEAFNNITVTIEVEGYEEQTIQCYRLTGAGVDTLKVGDEITVFGKIKNYKGTVEFEGGCTRVLLAPDDPAQIVADAYALAEGESLGYEAVLTGKIVSVDEAYSDNFKNITVTIAVKGCEDKPIVCFRLKGEGVDTLAVGDTITVAGTIKNYYGTVEFNVPYLLEKAAAGVTVSGAAVSGADGDATIELIADGAVIASATASGIEGTYSIENVAAGTYTLKVSKANHVTREYTVTVDAEDVVQDVKIHMVGDIDGNGKVNTGDVAKLNAHLKGTNKLTDPYWILCANVNGGSLNMGDTASLYSHIKGTKKLY